MAHPTGTLTTVLWGGALDHGDTCGSPTAPGWWWEQRWTSWVSRTGRPIGVSVSLRPTGYWPESILRGHLAESWENPDPLTYIYTIRDNVFFHNKPPVNGRQLTADDMAANYERFFAIGRFAGQERSPVGNATALIPMESVTATDELMFEIKLSRPFRDTHRLLTGPWRGRSSPECPSAWNWGRLGCSSAW